MDRDYEDEVEEEVMDEEVIMVVEEDIKAPPALTPVEIESRWQAFLAKRR